MRGPDPTRMPELLQSLVYALNKRPKKLPVSGGRDGDDSRTDPRGARAVGSRAATCPLARIAPAGRRRQSPVRGRLGVSCRTRSGARGDGFSKAPNFLKAH